MSFGEMLRTARERRGYTQQQVADRMGLDKSTYCGYETGKRSPDVPKIKQLSQILGASADELLETGFEKNTAPATKGGVGGAKQTLLDALDGIDDAEMLAILDVIKSVKKLKGP